MINVSFQDADTFAAKWFRRLPYLLLSEGVFPSPQWATPLKVQAKATPNMSVDVLGGDCIIQGEPEAGTQFATDYGNMIFTNDATVNLAISAAHATLARKDIVIAKCYDNGSGAGSYGDLIVVTGTPAGSPTEPALPENAYKLATVDVAAAAASITNSNITDRRLPAYMNQGMAASARAYLAGAQNHTSSNNWQKVTLDTEAWDTLNNFASSKFIAPVAGKYQVNGAVSFGTGSGNILVAVHVNGINITTGPSIPNNTSTGAGHAGIISDVLNLAANDYVELYAWQGSGGTLAFLAGAANTYLSVHQLSRNL